MASSREKQRQQKTPEGNCLQEKAVNTQGTEGVPSISPAQTRGTTREENYTHLMEQVVERQNMLSALRRVESNKGAPGTDGMTTESLRSFLKEQWPGVRKQLLNVLLITLSDSNIGSENNGKDLRLQPTMTEEFTFNLKTKQAPKVNTGLV